MLSLAYLTFLVHCALEIYIYGRVLLNPLPSAGISKKVHVIVRCAWEASGPLRLQLRGVIIHCGREAEASMVVRVRYCTSSAVSMDHTVFVGHVGMFDGVEARMDRRTFPVCTRSMLIT